MQLPKRPFYILALAPFCPTPETDHNPRLIPVDISSVDDAMSILGPTFVVPLPKELCPNAGITLEICDFKSFKPDMMVKGNALLKAISEAGKYVEQALSGGTYPAGIARDLAEKWPDLPPDLIHPPEGAGAQPSPAKSAEVDDILSMVAMPGGDAPSISESARDWPGAFKARLKSILKEIFANQEFRKYEAAWRGLDSLIRQAKVREGDGVRLEIGAISPENLAESLEILADKLALDLPGLVLIDQPFDNTPRSISLLDRIAEFSETLLAPAAVWLDKEFFYLKDWSGLSSVQYIKNHLEDAAYAKWRKLKELGGAAWMALLLNRYLARAPYGPLNKPKSVMFDEFAPLWISPVWALGAAVSLSISHFGWPSRFTEYTQTALTDLTLLDVTGSGPMAVEIALSEDRILEFIEAGITPLIGPIRKDKAFFARETTLVDNSFRFQLFMSKLLSFLFWLKDNLDQQLTDGDLAQNLTAAIAQFWEKSGSRAPSDLTIIAGAPSERGGIPLNISFTPTHDAIQGAGKLEFTFAW